MSLLVVEDVPTMRELLDWTLKNLPEFRVSGLAGNVAEARLEVSRRRPQGVLLDEVLPGESSLDLLSELKDLQIPVVLLTSLEGRTTPLPSGALGRLVKPTWENLEEDRKRFRKELLALFSIDAGSSSC
jgi:response regulator of citrate/malate metabolism